MKPVVFLLLALLQETEFERGSGLFRRGKFREALEAFEQAVAKAPTANHLKALGTVHAAMENYLAAEGPLGQACALNPNEEDACYYHGRSLYALDRYEASLVSLGKAKAGGSRPWRVSLAIGQALEALGRAAEAEAEYRKSILEAPSKPANADMDNPRADYGLFLYRQGRIEEAIGMLDAAVKTDASPRALYLSGRAYLQAGRLKEALARLEMAIQRNPAYAEAHNSISQAYRRLGRLEDAERHSRLAGRPR
jgi:tetratricopeptide (TPR) repeat protein